MAKRKNKKAAVHSRKRTVWMTVAIFVVAVCAFIGSYRSFENADRGVSQPTTESLAVYYIDVGQGDCELIRCGEHSVLIDAGEAEYANKVIACIRDLGIDKLDCIVSTHPHSDHAGGLSYVIEEIGASHIIMPELTEKNIPTTKTYERLMDAVAASDAVVHAAVPGDSYSFGDIRFTLYSPVFEEDDELNNMSVVFRLTYGDTSFLFTGDAEKQVEKQLLADGVPLRSDVLKVPHHGSKTSSTEDFINAVHPSIAVVCCGDGTKNHPHADTVERLTAIGAQTYRTDYNGTVTVVSDGKTLSVKTEK